MAFFFAKADPYSSRERDPGNRLQVNQSGVFLVRFCRFFFEILQPETGPCFRRIDFPMKPMQLGTLRMPLETSSKDEGTNTSDLDVSL